MRISKVLTMALVMTFTTLSAFAQTVTVPNTFVSGQPAVAADVNANFQALVTAVNNLQTQVNKLNGTQTLTAADLAGTYSIYGYQSEVDGGGTIQFETYTGTLTIAADSTYSGTISGAYANNNGGTGYNYQKDSEGSSSQSGTVSISGSTVTLTSNTGGETHTGTIARGGAAFVEIRDDDNTTATNVGRDMTLLIFVRN